jgi:hypothetical protein
MTTIVMGIVTLAISTKCFTWSGFPSVPAMYVLDIKPVIKTAPTTDLNGNLIPVESRIRMPHTLCIPQEKKRTKKHVNTINPIQYVSQSKNKFIDLTSLASKTKTNYNLSLLGLKTNLPIDFLHHV